ncbi:PAS domain-containing protein [Niveibacterium sp.]|uniref:PAS domain-containing protein n=1 Tax=Niveibacterium sp. TaxID=2017444 RepID=UPI0035AFE736
MSFGRILPRLMLGFLLLSALPVGGLAWWADTAFERTLTATVLTHLSAIADKKSDQINSYLEERVADSRALANSPTAQHALSVLPSLLASTEATQYQIEAARYREYFLSVQDNVGGYDLLLTAADGNVVFSVLHEADFDSNLDTGPYRDSILAHAHRQALALLTTQVTPVAAYAPSGGRPTVFIVSPVIRDGKPIGTVALQLSLEHLNAVVTDATGLGQSGETIVAQREGDKALYVVQLRRVPDAAFRLRRPLEKLGEPMQAAIRGERGSGIGRDYASVRVAAAWRYLPALRWYMVVKIDADEAFAPATQLRAQSLTALALIALAALAMSVVLARGIVKPIRQLLDATQRIAAGDLHERAPLARSGEFRELGVSFNRMAERLADEQALLEQRVTARTQELAQSNARFDDLVRRISAGIYVFRADAAGGGGGGGFDYVSPRFCELLDVDETAIARDPLLPFSRVHPADVGELLRRQGEAVKNMAPFRIEVRFIVRGETRWLGIESEGTPQGNGISVWNGVVTDVTERKLVEAAEHESEQRLALATRAAGAGIWDWDVASDVLLWDDTMFALYHATRDEFSGAYEAWVTRIHPDDRARTEAELDAALRGAGSFDTEFRIITPDGEVRHLRALAVIVRAADGTPLRAVGVNRDVTESRRQEAALRNVADEQTAIFESASLGIALLRKRVVEKCNRRLEEMLGYGRDELIGRTTRDWYLDEAAYVAGGTIYAELETGGIHRRDQELKRKDGSRFICALAGRAIDPNDLTRGTVWLFEDVTQERQLAAEMASARHAAEAANRAKSEFLANMSHEIRTPMNAVLGLTELALDGELSSEQREYLNTALASGRTLLGVLNDILDYSKVEAGQLQIEQIPLRFGELVQDAANLFAARIEERGLGLRIELSSALSDPVLGDPLRIAQVLNNLIGNAVKFTEQGLIVLSAEPAPARTDGTPMLRCCVADSGIGLSEHQIARLFQPFTQVDGSITRRHGGSGLGLAICKRLVNAMGGEIAVESRAGEGARFSFTLPAVPAQALPAHWPVAAAATPPIPATATPRFDGTQVLLVEDNAQNQQVAEGFLARRGITVTTAHNGSEAVEWVAALRFDLVLMDLHMPVMGGLEATQRIHALPGCGGLPVVAMTAAVLPEDRRLSLEAGMVDFVAKPIEPALLDQVLLRWLPLAGQAAVPSDDGDALPPLPGFDLAAALYRLGGNAANLRRLLCELADDCASAADAIDASLAEGRVGDALGRLHAIKGAAGNLGAVALAGSAAAAEQALRSDGTQRPGADFAAALQTAVAVIRAHFDGRGAVPGERELPGLRDALRALPPYLERRELVPDALIETLRQLSAYDGPGEPLRRLLRQIDHFDHDAALATVAQLLATLNPEVSA